MITFLIHYVYEPVAWRKCARDQEQQRDLQRLWQLHPIPKSTCALNFRYWLWVPHKAEKPILSNKYWNAILSCTKSKRVFAFFGTTINGKNVTEGSKILSEEHPV